MRRRVCGLVGLLLLAGAAAAVTRSAKQLHRGRWDARLHRFRGDVRLRLAGKETWIKPKTGAPLYPGDEIKVGRKGYAEISLGASSVIHLRPESDFVLEELDPAKTQVRLKYGTLLQKLKSLLHISKMFGEATRFAVRTPGAVAAVRGTEFGVSVSSVTGATTAGVFGEGEVYLTAAGGRGAGRKLTPGDEAEISAQGKVSRVRSLTLLRKYRSRMRRLRKTLAAIQRRYRTLPLRKRRKLRERLKKRYQKGR